jgi:hypothetical protein
VGRVRVSSDVSEIKLVFSIPPHRPTPNIAPGWNVASTDPLPVVRYDAVQGAPAKPISVVRGSSALLTRRAVSNTGSRAEAMRPGVEGGQPLG